METDCGKIKGCTLFFTNIIKLHFFSGFGIYVTIVCGPISCRTTNIFVGATSYVKTNNRVLKQGITGNNFVQKIRENGYSSDPKGLWHF